MLWEVEILPKLHDPEKARVCQEFELLCHGQAGSPPVDLSSRGYLLEGDLSDQDAHRLLDELLLDPVVEEGRVGTLNAHTTALLGGQNLQAIATVLLKPGVMDPAAQSVQQASGDLGITLASVRTFRRYYAAAPLTGTPKAILFRKVLANEAVEQVIEGPLHLDHLTLGSTYVFQLIHVPLRELDDASLLRLSREGQLALNLAEMKAIQAHFQSLGREPTDVELETLAQTWSEHCSHKTLKGEVKLNERRGAGGEGREGKEGGDEVPLTTHHSPLTTHYSPLTTHHSPLTTHHSPLTTHHSPLTTHHYQNLLGETIFAATQEIRNKLGLDDWCVSVFEDNAGIVRFNEDYNVCFKVETHNHPSAIEPYGGASTGLGGVIRDPLGTGLGAEPICNTDVFCFAPPDMQPEELPSGVLHPLKVMKGVVSGVRDYGNRIGIPTVNGAVCFDRRYVGNPLVFCGTVGLIPVDLCRKKVEPGDFIVAVGGRTGRDGIHGATFSSIELTSESEKVSGGAVQIGNPITEKKMLDVLLRARDLRLYHAITDCGAGGFSSAIGEMGEKMGAVVRLDQAPLKYEGLSYTEIWISEAQERMILAIPPATWPQFQELCASEDVEASVLGTFEPTGKLQLLFHDQLVADLDMGFLHHGRPKRVASGEWRGAIEERQTGNAQQPLTTHHSPLTTLLSCWNVCSKEWIIRQYDHEVQGGSVLKPLVGTCDDGPGDAAVIMPVLGSWTGLAIGCGINPHYGDIDPYAMAALAIDEAVRNVVAVGADPSRVALLDNFCWGNTDRPEVLGSLVRAAEACRDVAIAYMTPFISGKDSLNNEFHSQGCHITIPPTLLISALGRVDDVRRCVTMDLKEPGNVLILLGRTRDELAGSHYQLVTGLRGSTIPQVDVQLAPRIFRQLHQAISQGLVRSCHDLSEGGLAVAIAEMAFAGGVGADVTELPDPHGPPLSDEALLFSESPSRFILEVQPQALPDLADLFGSDIPWHRIGQTCKEARLRIAGNNGEWIIWSSLAELKEAWQKPLRRFA